MTLRLAALGIVHEANTFALAPLDDEALALAGVERGPQIEAMHATAQTTMAGFLAARERSSVEVIPLIHAQPTPTGVMAKATFETFVGEMLSLLDAHGPWNGILLALHGAAVAEGCLDADAEIASRVRALVGPDIPIGAALDLHANLSERLIDACDVTVAYRTNPHVDARERASLCAAILIGAVRSELRPAMAVERLPACVEILRQGTTAQPMRGLMEACAEAEQAAGILAVSLTMGYPWADVPDLGMAVIVVADADDELARATARRIAELAWSERDGFLGRGMPIKDAIATLDEDTHDSTDGPVLLLDIGDNIGGGSPGDSVVLLDATLRAGVRGTLAIVVDPAAAAAAAATGVGGQVDLHIGADLDPRWGTPLRVRGRVSAVGSGRFEEVGPSHAGQRFFDSGTSVALELEQDTVVVLNSKPVLPTSLEQVRSLGIDPGSIRVVIAKGVHSPLAAWLPICRRAVFVDTPGVTSADLSRLAYRHRQTPLFPFERTATYPAPATSGDLAVTDLHCQVPAGVLASGSDAIRLTWRVAPARPGSEQLSYEVEASPSADFEHITASTEIQEGAEQVAVPAPGPPLISRESRSYRVRISTDEGWTSWGPVLTVEAGLLEGADWKALAVTLPRDPGAVKQAPSPLLRREFELQGDVVRARLHVTSLGVHQLALNGKPVTDDLLSPGWTSYQHRLTSETYDVTDMLVPGANVFAGTLGDGWYRGRLGWDPGDDRHKYGRDVALIAQLEVEMADGSVKELVTDRDWSASTGEIRSADFYDGTVVDLRERKDGWQLPGYDTSGWSAVSVVPFDTSLIEPRMAPPVRVVDVIPVAATRGSTRVTSFDGGQNIVGFVRLAVRGKRGDLVTVRHAEALEPDGSLHTRSLRSAKATDSYTLSDEDVTELEPAFTFHGFRHAEVETEAEILRAEFVVISSDAPVRGRFECSEPLLNRFHENVVWSQRDNFVSVPTDCPQRDERLGWTGDAQAFATTASTLFDSQAFWASWLRDLALDQHDELGVSSVVPDVVLDGELRYGRAGWGDAATMVPWAVYEAYGDRHILRSQLDSMKRWVASLSARRGTDGLLPSSWQFGDWLDPDAPADRPWEAKADSDFLANAFFVHSTRLFAEAASLLGEETWAAGHHALADEVAAATWARWADHVVTTQTGCAVALRFAIAPESERSSVAAVLARLVRDSGGRVATGFLGTPLVLPALADAGLYDEAYLMLLCRDAPSWLYQVEKGATTVWERWDAIKPDGSIHPGSHMLSFNHYAYGAVIDWVYRHVAGLAPQLERPGYRGVVFAPKPATGIDHAGASVESPYGTVGTTWRIDDAGDLAIEVDLPFGTTGTVVVPVTEGSRITVDGEGAAQGAHLAAGRHSVIVTAPRIAGTEATTEAPSARGRA